MRICVPKTQVSGIKRENGQSKTCVSSHSKPVIVAFVSMAHAKLRKLSESVFNGTVSNFPAANEAIPVSVSSSSVCPKGPLCR